MKICRQFQRIFILTLLITNHVAAQRPSFPLKISENRRYFTDQTGKPFLYNADTPWLIFIKLTTAEAVEYIKFRKSQGFNTLQTMLAMEVNAKDREGHYIFDGDNDFKKPNEAYHNHVLKIINIADSLGLLVVMSQPWLGCCEEAFGNRPDKPIRTNGTEKNRFYGRYLGKKFASCKNLFWIMGGDSDPKEDLAEIEAFAEGLRETAPAHQLITYHAGGHSSTDIFQHAKWLGFSMVYTYWKDKPHPVINPELTPEVYEACLKEYTKSLVMPFVLGESQYEGNEASLIGTPDMVRRQVYWTILCGGAGHAYGSVNWHIPANWREIMKYPGAYQVGHFYNFFTALPWWRLVPDLKHNFVVAGYGEFSRLNYVTTAVSDDKKTAVSYLYQRRTIVADLSKLAGTIVHVKWFNPRTGEYIVAGDYTPGLAQFTPPISKELQVLQETGHWDFPEHNEVLNNWLLKIPEDWVLLFQAD